MKYNQKYIGKYYSLQGGEVYYYNKQGRLASTGAYTTSTVVVLLTGYYVVTDRGAVMYQTTGGGFIDLADGWIESGTGVVPTRTRTAAQILVNTIIKNNKHILNNNLLCARYQDKLTDSQKDKLYELQKRLQRRNSALQAEGVLGNIETSYPRGYVAWQNDLEQFMQSYTSGVGVVLTTTAVIVISAIVMASMGTAAYFAFKAYASESADDVKYSDELTKILTSKLTEEEYEQLKTETEGIVTKARIKASIGGATGLLKYGIVGAGIAAIIYTIVKNN